MAPVINVQSPVLKRPESFPMESKHHKDPMFHRDSSFHQRHHRSSPLISFSTIVTVVCIVLHGTVLVQGQSAPSDDTNELDSSIGVDLGFSVDCYPGDPTYPHCKPCRCNLTGVSNPDNCDPPCQCKVNVEGDLCDRCKPGTVDLNSDNPDGCSRCFCFGVTNSCRTSYWPSQVISNPADWMISDLQGINIVEPQQEDDHLVIADDDAPSTPLPYYYWSAPKDYLGDQYAAYGRKVKISLSATVLRGDSAGNPVQGPDIVLEGGTDENGQPFRIGYIWKAIPFQRAERTKINRKVVLKERDWFKVGLDGSNEGPISREQMALVLSDLRRFLIRAYFHTDQIEGSFYNVDLLVASSDGHSDTMNPITEECDCPEGYEKPSCGPGCAPGYRRVNNTLIGGQCFKCDCNNHAATCDPYTGECLECLHNTRGPKCGQCRDGFYGYPWIGREDDCKVCACPRSEPSNNFSPTCIAIGNEGDYVCDDCRYPYTGPRCNLCADGFIGDPTQLNGSCVPIGSIVEYTEPPLQRSTTSTPSSLPNPWTDDWTSYQPIERTSWPPSIETIVPTTCPPPAITTMASESIYNGASETWQESSWKTEPPTITTSTTTTTTTTTTTPQPIILTPEECGRTCTGLHLPDIWFMEGIINEVDIDDIFHLPYALMSLLRKEPNARDHFKRKQSSHQNARQLLDGNFLDQLEANLTMTRSTPSLTEKVENLEKSGLAMISGLAELLSSATSSLESIRLIQSSLGQMIDRLDQVDSNTIETIPVIWEKMYHEAGNFVQRMAKVDFTLHQVEASIAREESDLILNRARTFVSGSKEFQSMSSRIHHISLYLGQFEGIIDEKVKLPIQSADQLVYHVRSFMDEMKRNFTRYQELVQVHHQTIMNGLRYLEESSKVYLGVIPKSTADVESMKVDLNRSVLAVERVRNVYSRLNPFYEDVYVRPCRERSAKEIARINEAKEYYDGVISSLRPYLSIPEKNNRTIICINQSMVYATAALESSSTEVLGQMIRDEKIGQRASEARINCDRVYQQVDQESREYGEKSRAAWENVIQRYQYEEQNVEAMTARVENTTSEIKNLSKGIGPRSRDTIQFSFILEIGLKNIEAKVEEINESLVVNEFPQAKKFEGKWIQENGRTAKSINKAVSSVNSTLDMVRRVQSASSKATRQQQSVEASLADLKKRILLARQKAAEIRVALSADPGQNCVRTFAIETQPSSANSISMNYALHDDSIENALLFFIASNPSRGVGNNDFLAIDMIDRRIRFLWDLGDGLNILSHPLRLEATGRGSDDDSRWYRIDAHRIGTIGGLNVQRILGNHVIEGPPVTKVDPSKNFTILDVRSSDLLYIGGYPSAWGGLGKIASEMTETARSGFRGCLSDLYFDEKLIGLWNFKSSTGCQACQQGALESWDLGGLYFNGKSSYTVLDQIPRYDSKEYQVVLFIKTFDENAIIFFCSDWDTGNYIAINMRQGRVVFQFKEGSEESSLKLATDRKYNTGEWTRVLAARSDSRAMLSVEDETIEGEIDSVNSDLGDCKIHFGGVPPNFTTDLWPEIDFKPFLGCMKDVQIDTTPLNLLDGEAFGITAGCHNLMARSVKFLGNGGYLELMGIPLREDGQFSLTFKTRQKEAILLMSTFKKARGNREFVSKRLFIVPG